MNNFTCISKTQYTYLLTEFDKCGILYSCDADSDGIPNSVCEVARDANCDVIMCSDALGYYLTELGLDYIKEFIIPYGGV